MSADIVQGTQPVFTTPIVVDYYFDSLQYLRFEARTPLSLAAGNAPLSRTHRLRCLRAGFGR
jgi:hypothetical protein